MSTIQVADSLIPSVVNKPLDARTVVSSTNDIEGIELPYVGMRVYCTGNGKEYRVISLKSKTIGALVVEDAAVDEYEEIEGEEYSPLTEITALTGTSVTVAPGGAYAWTVSENSTLNISGGEVGKTGDCLIDITLGTATVTAGTGLTISGALAQNETNKCCVRWEGAAATLYVLGGNQGGGSSGGGVDFDATMKIALIYG